MGVGVLYGKEKYLEKMPPYQTGGSMINQVTFEKTTFQSLPHKFEAGTPNVAGVIGLMTAITTLGSQVSAPVKHESQLPSTFRSQASAQAKHETQLLEYAVTQLNNIPGLTIYGTSPNKIGVLSFSLDCAHAHDIATILDQHNIAVRAGHHCAMPLMDYLNVPALTRISFGVYNELSDVDALIVGLQHVRKLFHD